MAAQLSIRPPIDWDYRPDDFFYFWVTICPSASWTLDHFAELGGFAGLALADDLGLGFEDADDLALGMGVAALDTFTGLIQHLLDPGQHRFHVLSMTFDGQLIEEVVAGLDALIDSRTKRRA
jgi:hypothetical protein